MKAYIHAFQGRPWNEECLAAYNGFRKLGIECVLFSTNEELDTRSPKDIVVGGMLIMSHVLNQMGITPENYNYPEPLLPYCGREIWVTKRKDLEKETLPVFIKPLEEKAAAGIVVNSWKDIKDYRYLDPESEILCSEPVHFMSEWRCFVRYGEILGIQFYAGNKEIKYDRTVIVSAVKDFKDMPAAFSLDFGVTDDGRTLLIEMNDGMAIGCYGLPDKEYALFLIARWFELIGVKDRFEQTERESL